MISILRIVPFKLEDWRQLPTVAKNIGTIGKPIQGLWKWTLIYRTSFSMQMRVLSGFMAQVHTGYFGQGKQVKHCTVSSALTAVGQTIALACNDNPTKIYGSKKLLPRLAVILDGYRKEDPATIKKLPVQSDVPNS
jgi:hypothetical protein